MAELLTTTARCLCACGWTPPEGAAAADRGSAKHTKDTKHPTAVVTVPGRQEGK